MTVEDEILAELKAIRQLLVGNQAQPLIETTKPNEHGVHKYETYDHDHGRCVDNRCELKGIWHGHERVAPDDPTRSNDWIVYWCGHPNCIHRYEGQHGSIHSNLSGN